MEIILLQDIKTLGKKGEQVNVKDGYARNLISKKQAVEANEIGRAHRSWQPPSRGLP